MDNQVGDCMDQMYFKIMFIDLFNSVHSNGKSSGSRHTPCLEDIFLVCRAFIEQRIYDRLFLPSKLLLLIFKLNSTAFLSTQHH